MSHDVYQGCHTRNHPLSSSSFTPLSAHTKLRSARRCLRNCCAIARSATKPAKVAPGGSDDSGVGLGADAYLAADLNLLAKDGDCLGQLVVDGLLVSLLDAVEREHGCDGRRPSQEVPHDRIGGGSADAGDVAQRRVVLDEACGGVQVRLCTSTSERSRAKERRPVSSRSIRLADLRRVARLMGMGTARRRPFTRLESGAFEACVGACFEAHESASPIMHAALSASPPLPQNAR